MISKTEEHEINRTGRRLLRETVEPLGWVVNEVQEDYAIDSNVQVFDGKSPTGAWFHVQLKSSACSRYSADRTFVSQELLADHARHYAVQMRQPVILIHADVVGRNIYWYAPQLDPRLTNVLARTGAKFITLRIPTRQQLPSSAPDLLGSLDAVYLTLASKELTSASNQSFAESIRHFPDQESFHRAFQEKADTLKLQKVVDLYRSGKWDEARPRADAILADPDSTIEVKFWAQVQVEGIDFAKSVHAGKPQSEVPKIILANAKALQRLTRSGPKYLKFYSLVARKAAELEILAHESVTVSMALHQHLLQTGNPATALGLYARKSALTSQIATKYNQCLRLARYAAQYPDRWMLGRALPRIVNPIGKYLITLHSEGNLLAEKSFAQSALQICKLAAWICHETGDSDGTVLAVLAALLTTHSEDSEAYRWAIHVANSLVNPQSRKDAWERIQRAKKRWHGEAVEGDYRGDTPWQIIQNMSSALGIDISDEKSPLVQALRIAAKDNSPERVLAQCEHIIVSQGATGPLACQVWALFNITTAGSKVVHCTLHDFHVEARELDEAYATFASAHCDSCPDQKPRSDGWRYTDAERHALQARHHEFVARLSGTPHGFRFASED